MGDNLINNKSILTVTSQAITLLSIELNIAWITYVTIIFINSLIENNSSLTEGIRINKHKY
jgi:hypothetical protein